MRCTKDFLNSKNLSRLDDYFGLGGAWMAFRHDDVVAILRDNRFIKDIRKFIPQQKPSEENAAVMTFMEWLKNNPNMAIVDPPDHTRLRKLVSKAFTPNLINDLEPCIQKIANILLDSVQQQGKMDILQDYAFPLSIMVISEMLGIPDADRNKFREWTHTLVSSAALKTNQAEVINATLKEFFDYIKVLLAAKRYNPGNDLITSLLHAYEEGDCLSENELLSTIWLLISAGHETTANVIANGTLALLQHPNQIHLLQNNPALLSSTVEEILRCVGPVILASRIAGEDMLIHGKQISKGERVVLNIAVANRDPHKFTNPADFDITREENEHLAFGKGIHFCMGAPLARLETKIAFRILLQRMPNLRLAIEPNQVVYSQSNKFAFESLPVTF